MAATIPKKIGKYDVLDVIGKGGMGVVYRAKDPFLDRMVAIKIMTISYADYPDLLQRFYREAKATANLQHPNIVTVYELGEHEGSPYLAMQYLEGASLEVILRSGQPLSLMQKIDVIIQACHGLSYAHQRGIVHRDIKPGNIMVLKDSSVKIVDFGIARIGDTNFTRTGQFMGSLNYMSLEQLNDKLQVDQRTDVYSTGVVLYQILTGALPFEAESTGATLMKILNDAPPPFSKYLSSYSPELETITMKALAKDRDQRYGSADELALDLTQLLDRMKGEKIGVHMENAERMLQENDLFQANDELMEVLRLDKQHTRAASMLRTLRKQIEKEQSAERARHLREQAEEAFQREDFEPALGYLEQAIHIDTTNVDLQNFRSKVQAAKAEIEQLRQMIQRAENAHRAGNLDTAKQAIEEVLSRRPNDTRVKSLYRMIQKELDDRMRQKRMETLLEAARKEMASRHFTAAVDILKEAEKVDPESPALRSLLDSFTTARDQEQKRRALEQLTRQIEQALNTDEHQTALNLVADGLQKFPTDPALLKLKDLAETQKQAAQTKAFVRERIAAAREILNAGNAGGALKVLQDALKKAPGNPHLESLVSIAQERLAQDRDDQAKSRCVQQANEALGRRSYDEAIQVLEAGQVRFAASPEIDNLLRFAREQQVKESKQQDVENSVRRAQEFLRGQEYDQAIALLESILARTPDEELRVVLEEARRRRDDLNRQITAAIARGQQFLSEGSPAKAAEFLQSQPTAFRRSAQFRELVFAAVSQNRAPEPEPPVLAETDLDAPEPAGTMVWGSPAPPDVEPQRPTRQTPRVATGRVVVPTPAPTPVQPKPPGLLQRFTKQQMLLIGAVAGVIVFIVLIVVLWPSSKQGTLIVHSNTGGADVLVDGKPMATTGSDLNAVLKLDQGSHVIRLQHDGYETSSADVTVAKDKQTEIDLPLTPKVVDIGTLAVQTNVSDVEVYIDNDAKRLTNGKRLDLTLPAGDHQVRVSKDKYDQVPAKQVHIDKDQKVTLAFNLTETKGNPGYLKITSMPGASVTVDGKSWGVIPSEGEALVQVIPKPKFVVEVTSSNTELWKKTVGPVKENQTLPVEAKLTLKPVAPKPAASVVSFTSSSTIIQPGQSVHLSWETKNANQVDIEGVGSNVGASGSKDIAPPQTTIYKLTAIGEGGRNDSRTVTVTVAAPPPKAPTVSAFGANPSRIKLGDSTTLTWSTAEVQSVTIDNVGSNLPPSGSRQISPSQSTSYKLTATGPGGTAEASASVTVDKATEPSGGTGGGTTGGGSDEQARIMDALQRHQRAYTDQVVDDLKREWTGMPKEQEKALEKLFKNPNLKALGVEEQPCSAPQVSGSTATITCTETTYYTAEGKRKPVPNSTRQVAISLKKVGDVWRVDTKVPTGK